jgi:hypothetical protein
MSVMCVKVGLFDSYHDIDCCDKTLGIDNLLSKYKSDRESILNMMLKDPNKLIQTIWSVNSPLAIDNNCLCKMSKRNYFTCAQCKNISRITDFKYNVDEPIQIECGSLSGKKIIVKSHGIISPFLKIDLHATQKVKKYGLKCIVGDDFTISTFNNWIIEDIFKKSNLPHISNLYTSFICNNNGYSVSRYHKLVNLSDINNVRGINLSDIGGARSIILQLLVILTELEKYDFFQSCPTLKSLYFVQEPVSYLYNNVHVEGPITLKIDNLEQASINYGGMRYYSKNVENTISIEKNTFVPEMNINGSYYKLTNINFDIYIAMRQIGIPLFTNSFNFYCLMVALMCNESFYNNVMSNQNVDNIWKNMWLPENLILVENAVKELHSVENVDANIIFDIVKGLWLRHDIVNYIWTLKI